MVRSMELEGSTRHRRYLKLAQSGYIRSYAAWVVVAPSCLYRCLATGAAPMSSWTVLLAIWLFPSSVCSKNKPGPAACGADHQPGLDFWFSLGFVAPYWFANPGGSTFLYRRAVDQLPAHPTTHVMLDGFEPLAGLADHLAHAYRGAGVMEEHRDHRVKEFFAFLSPSEVWVDRPYLSRSTCSVLRVLEISLVPMYFLIRNLGT